VTTFDPESLKPEVAAGVAGLVRLGVVVAEPVATASSAEALEAEMQELASALRAEYVGRAPAEIGALGYARELYHSFGVDPTRVRPSSEALLRRVLKGGELPRISNAVDVCNLCSLRFLLPLGLYDVREVHPPVTLRRGRPGEAYAGIGKKDVHLEGRLVLADRHGPFGNPTSDSARTSVRAGTTALMLVIFAPPSYPHELMEDNVRTVRSTMERHLAPPGESTLTSGTVHP
jgi:DNA/RNA-binding domain of Phe-tRNA-synthetase-like protein